MHPGSADERGRGETQSCFTGRAADYERSRPGYPAAAIRSILEGLPPSPRVADVGCGTGISSRALALGGAIVFGIEPNAEMRAAAAAAAPAGCIDYREGRANHTGLAEASVHAVVCAQSFHWFDPLPALAEFHRIIRPGGRLALMWNVRSQDNEFSVAYEELIDETRRAVEATGRPCPTARSTDPTIGGYFTDAQLACFENPIRYDLAALLGRARSTSSFPREGPDRARLEGAITGLFAKHSQGGFITLGQRCEVTIAMRRGRSV